MNEERLLEMLPDHFAKLKQMKAIAKAEGKQFDRLDADIDDLLNQGFIKTATWGLRYWEERYRLPVLENSLDYEGRRQRVLAKKMSNKAKLIDILRALEPSIDLAWGPLLLPFTIHSYVDYYDFGELIRVIEEEKPSHLTYSFTVKPSGYTVGAKVAGRDRVSLQLISGTSNAGRWPSASTIGRILKSDIHVKSEPIRKNKVNYPFASTFYTNKDAHPQKAPVNDFRSYFGGSLETSLIFYKTVNAINICGMFHTGKEVSV